MYCVLYCVLYSVLYCLLYSVLYSVLYCVLYCCAVDCWYLIVSEENWMESSIFCYRVWAQSFLVFCWNCIYNEAELNTPPSSEEISHLNPLLPAWGQHKLLSFFLRQTLRPECDINFVTISLFILEMDRAML